MKRELSDPFAQFNEFQNFDIYVADGHYHHAAAFDLKPSTPTAKTNATGHFFRLDLRSHDITVIKRTSKE